MRRKQTITSLSILDHFCDGNEYISSSSLKDTKQNFNSSKYLNHFVSNVLNSKIEWNSYDYTEYPTVAI